MLLMYTSLLESLMMTAEKYRNELGQRKYCDQKCHKGSITFTNYYDHPLPLLIIEHWAYYSVLLFYRVHNNNYYEKIYYIHILYVRDSMHTMPRSL